MSAITPPKRVVHYPDDDGLPMSDNTIQFRWIVTVQGNPEAQFRASPDVFVAGNHLIYPVEDDADTKQAPDVYVVFGRPKGDRGSYKVWEEGGIFPQVVFEIWSPGNRFDQMQKKFAFYEAHGVDEYYILYPEFPAHVEAWRREGEKLVGVENVANWVSPRLGIRLGVIKGELFVRGPSGRLFLSPSEIAAERDTAEKRAESETQRAEKLAAKLRELGINPDTV